MFKEKRYPNRLKQVREDFNVQRANSNLPKMTQADLAKIAGCSRAMVAKVESEEAQPTMTVGLKICRALYADPWEVFEIPRDPVKRARPRPPETLARQVDRIIGFAPKAGSDQ